MQHGDLVWSHNDCNNRLHHLIDFFRRWAMGLGAPSALSFSPFEHLLSAYGADWIAHTLRLGCLVSSWVGEYVRQ